MTQEAVKKRAALALVSGYCRPSGGRLLYACGYGRGFSAKKMRPVVATLKTAWLRVITDITRQSKKPLVSWTYQKSAVIGWKQSAEPGHSKGEAL
ncbi:hypothetical protein [Mixta theicola]|uniref:hypothetical protein n=1 Tax=Mixta theicola TaxID=1458355 RepID=UPI0010572967|nr:hypothetical protein [Mixta theicola]